MNPHSPHFQHPTIHNTLFYNGLVRTTCWPQISRMTRIFLKQRIKTNFTNYTDLIYNGLHRLNGLFIQPMMKVRQHGQPGQLFPHLTHTQKPTPNPPIGRGAWIVLILTLMLMLPLLQTSLPSLWRGWGWASGCGKCGKCGLNNSFGNITHTRACIVWEIGKRSAPSAPSAIEL